MDQNKNYVEIDTQIEKETDPAAYLKELVFGYPAKTRFRLSVHNRLGVRYFCGDRDPYTDRNFDGIEDYGRAYSKPEDTFYGRMYDRQQLEKILRDAGIDRYRFYSVMPGLEEPEYLISEDYQLSPYMLTKLQPVYHYPDTVFLDEERLYKGLIQNGLFHRMSNAYVIEFSKDGELSDSVYEIVYAAREKTRAVRYILHENHTQTAEAIYPEGEAHIRAIKENEDFLRARGIPVVEGKLESGIYCRPVLEAENGQDHLLRLFDTDREKFYQDLDQFRELILRSSDGSEGVYQKPIPEHETEEEKKNRLKYRPRDWELEPTLLFENGMFDMIPENSYYVNGEFVLFDQETCIKDYPANAMITRMIQSLCIADLAMPVKQPQDELLRRYGLPDGVHGADRSRFLNISYEHQYRREYRRELEKYYQKMRRNADIENANRQRLNFAEDDYQRMFIDIFEYADTRKLILFGSGLFARRFLTLYADDYPVYAVIDNNEERKGQMLYPEGADDSGAAGVPIYAPGLLNTMQHGEYKILICIKNYLSVMGQLERMGIREYAIFDPSKAYQKKRHPIPKPDSGAKKYHVGYIAGVFDLYHIGHLNMFRRAKELCDYLIVGVVSDEGVRRFKNTDPFVPYEERVEMVASCRYVDEAVEIPYMFGGTEDAWRLHHFDVQFSGSDYVNDPSWEKNKDFLERHGATLEFFPYTQSTSSSKLKDLINKNLI